MAQQDPVEVEEPYTATAGADGTAVISASPTTNLRAWLVTQVSIECTSATASSTCTLRKNGNLITPLAPGADAAAGDPAVSLATSDVLTVEWSGLPVGAPCSAYLIYQEIR